MKRVIRALILVLGALGLFSAGVVGTLGMRGKLNRDYLAPILGLAPAPEHAGGAGVGGARKDAGPSRPEDVLDERVEPDLKASVLPRIMLPSPFSAEEMDELLQELQSTRTDLKERVTVMDRELRDLDLIRADLNRRWDELDRREELLQEEAHLLVAERDELNGRSLILKEAEIENLKNLAEGIEKMGAASAAGLLQEMTHERGAKILSFMKPRERGKILAALPPEFASKLSDRLLGLLNPDLNTGAGSGAGK